MIPCMVVLGVIGTRGEDWLLITLSKVYLFFFVYQVVNKSSVGVGINSYSSGIWKIAGFGRYIP